MKFTGIRSRISSQWAIYLGSAVMYAAALLRTVIIYRERSELWGGLLLLAAWLGLFLSQPAISRRWKGYFPLYLVLQVILIVLLFQLPFYPDYFAVLCAVLAMQIVTRYPLKISLLLIALFTPLVIVLSIPSVGIGQAAALGILYTGGNALMASFAVTARRAQAARLENLSLAESLAQSNRQLEEYAARLQGLSVAHERNNLARELHDSVTQTIFSMTLTIKSALLLLDLDPSRVGAQMERLTQLAQGALAELRLLISELGPEKLQLPDLKTAIRRHLDAAGLPESFTVGLESRGEGVLTAAENKSLFRIVQEALNNTIKHAGAGRAAIRLHLEEPYRVEIEDNGRGFDPQHAGAAGHIGLQSMRERAAEIGWEITINSSPGTGTSIVVHKPLSGGEVNGS